MWAHLASESMDIDKNDDKDARQIMITYIYIYAHFGSMSNGPKSK